MKKISSLLLVCLGSTLYVACGGGGVSDGFTREINDVQTAWTNATSSFTAALDSVKQARAGWESMMTGMTVPDSLQSHLTTEYKARLDSVKEVCNQESRTYDALQQELETSKTNWDNDSKVFASWKDKVFKSEIDIETARKDLKDYQAKVKETTGVSNKVGSRLNEIRQHCAANCKVYDELVAGIPKEEPTRQRRRGR